MGDVNVIAYTPQEKAKFLLPNVREFYDYMDVEIRLMEPEIEFASPYKQGNKILACLQERDTAYTLFLDTDTAVMQPFAAVTGLDIVSVVPEGVQGWGGNPGSWEYVYEKFGLPFPEERVRLTRSIKLVPPYFNAGMIGFPTNSDFARSWFRIAFEIDADPNIKHKRPWLDQISLPLAIRLTGLRSQVMDMSWNLSISHPSQKRHQEKFFDLINAINAKIIHFYQPAFFQGTKFLPVIDQAIAEQTIYANLAGLTAAGDARQARRTEVWARFGERKKIPKRTPEESNGLKALSEENNYIKSFRNNIDRLISIAPNTIIKPIDRSAV